MQHKKQPVRSREEKIIQELDAAILMEEMAIPVYSSHLASTVGRIGVSEENSQRIIDDLTVLETESKKHITMLKKVREILLQEGNLKKRKK